MTERDEKLRQIIYWHTCKIANIAEEGPKTDNEDKEIADIYKDTLSQINQLFSEGKDRTFRENPNKPTDKFGNCPFCNSPNNKIQWGWAGTYYDMICENGHIWKYQFKDTVDSNKKVAKDKEVEEALKMAKDFILLKEGKLRQDNSFILLETTKVCNAIQTLIDFWEKK